MAPRYHENSTRWHRLILKRNFECVRKCDRVKGFDHVCPWDIHWHRTGYASGQFNEFLELKQAYRAEDLREFNGESVVLIDEDWQRSFRAGSPCEIDVLVSLYGGRDLEAGTLEWRLEGESGVLLNGVLGGLTAPDGAVATAIRLRFTWPNVDQALKVVLYMRLQGDGYDLTNHWDFWVFPQDSPPLVTAAADDDARQLLADRYVHLTSIAEQPQATLRIVRELTHADAQHLANGGDVVLFGCEPFPSRPTSFQIGVAGRAMYDLATVINDHPIFKHLPHEGWCDWQFQSLMREGDGYAFNFYRDWKFSDEQRKGDVRCVVFNNLPVDFGPILEVASSYKQVRLQALLWEVLTDGGRLFVCSCHIDMNDPATVAMLDGIMEYVTGDAFRPKVKTTVAGLILPLLDGRNRRETLIETDKAAYVRTRVRSSRRRRPR
jgi:hypothetical protein